MGIRDLLASDSAALFADAAESITYAPKDGAGPFELTAVVRRDPPESREDGGRALLGVVRVLVRNSTDTTIGVAAPSEHGDKITLVFAVGEAPKTGRVIAVDSGNEAFWRLDVAP